MTTRVVIAGGGGRMGRALTEHVRDSSDFVLHGVLLSDDAAAPVLAGVPADIYRRDLDGLAGADVFIDFTAPSAVAAHADVCVAGGIAWVLGTTGLDAAQQELVTGAARDVPVCQAANFSTGVNLMLRLAALAAGAVDDETDLEVIEAHHRHKVDAPSGTALALGRVLADARGVDLDSSAVMSRVGITGARPAGAIGFSAIRGGDIVGEHTVLLAGDGEQLEIRHRAGTRLAFARGACRAAAWLAQQPPGLYDMQDVLRLRS